MWKYKVLIHYNPPFNRYLEFTSSLRPLTKEEIKEIADDFVKGEAVLFTPLGVKLKVL
jgi:hypothetical protein